MKASLPGDCKESPVGQAQLPNTDSVVLLFIEASWCSGGLQYAINSSKTRQNKSALVCMNELIFNGNVYALRKLLQIIELLIPKQFVGSGPDTK